MRRRRKDGPFLLGFSVLRANFDNQPPSDTKALKLPLCPLAGMSDYVAEAFTVINRRFAATATLFGLTLSQLSTARITSS